MGGTEVTINWNMALVWALVLVNVVTLVRSYLRDQDKKNSEAIKAVSEQLQEFIAEANASNTEQNQRLTGIEAVMKHMPTTEEVTSLREDVATVKARVEGQGQQLTRIDHMANLIYKHMLEHN